MTQEILSTLEGCASVNSSKEMWWVTCWGLESG